ncbi:hypothetical protein BGZ46_008147 [Entomortierella lignicola]|nr:hypothetical protein BGZ46_008147 [Entomortierella lignicola]
MQNSVRNSLSLNKAFAKIDRTPGESGHGCFWALQDHVRDSTDPLPCRKRKAPQSDTTSLTPTARSKGSSLPKLDCVTDSTSDCTTSFLDSAPSPAASEDAEDLKSPRRSGRARRPPRPKEAEDYIGPYPRQPSLSNASLSTPPSSPAPHGQDREVTPVAASARRRASSVKVEKIHPHLTHSDVSRDETTANRKAIQDADLASIPGVVTTQRIRRPPQNLAEFVSSEDFKAAPCGKRQERTLQSSASSSLNGSETESTPRERKEAKRSKSESHISYCHSGKRSNSMETDQPDADPNQPRESFDRSPSMPDLAAGSRLSHSNPTSQPATIPLSALSHSKCLNSKKQRRDSNSRPKSLYSKRHSSHEVPTRQQILERRRREGKREIMVASEDDWSDSDFDFLRDEEENYRMMRIRVRKIQRTCGRWSLRDNTNDDDGFDDAMEDEGFNSDDEQSRVEGEKIKLLMDPSVINYGFDSCDSKYILDFHQGPLFNNVTWPEFSDVKEDSNNGSNGNGNRNPSDSSNPLNNNSNTVHGRVLNSVTEEILHEVDQVNIDAQSVAEVLSELTKSVVLGSESIHPTECIPIIQEPTALPLPLITPSNSTNGEGRKQEAEEWALFVGNCGPKMECNTGASHRNMEIESETKLKDIISPLEEQQHVLPDSEIEAVVAAVASGAVADKSHAQMEDIITQVTSPIVVVKEEIEAENFIGWSLCE